ncbi:hypothetical protein REPUB_Repub18cG0166000 [Reevesia pubescens]
MENMQAVNNIVAAYSKRKGFKEAEQLLEDLHNKESAPIDFHNDPQLAKFIHHFSLSLDLYKHELLHVLYPVSLHSFMDLVAKGHLQEARTFFSGFREDHELMHSRDLQKLEGVLSQSHLEEMEFAHSLRQSKVNIKICQHSYDLLLQYLHKTQSTAMLGVINEHINFLVFSGQPGSISDDVELLEDSLEDRLEKAGGLLSDSEKTEGENKEGDGDETKKRSVEGGKQGASTKKLKKDKAVNATAKSARPELTPPLLHHKLNQSPLCPPTEVEQSILEDLRNRVQLSSVALPSVSFYTFLNAHNGLNCSSISHDGSLVAGGFSDSSLKVWDMTKLGQQGSNFRLWSTKLNANLVCYKGHNYPAWDVQFSPVGHYFASASHDRTARIWSMGRIQPLRIMVCVQWHANCNYIATGSSDKTVRLWDVQSGECVWIFIGHRSMILSLAISPDGRYMASGDEDGTIMMWDLSSGRCVTPLMCHTSCVWTLVFSCEGSLLASGCADCTVKLWDVTTSTKVPMNEEKSGNPNRPRSLKTLPSKSTPVHSLRFSRRNLLFTAGVLSKNL